MVLLFYSVTFIMHILSILGNENLSTLTETSHNDLSAYALGYYSAHASQMLRSLTAKIPGAIVLTRLVFL